MSTQTSYRRAPLLLLWAVLLSAVTAVFGATPLRVLRRISGSSLFWLLGASLVAIAVAIHWIPLAVILSSQFLLVGIYAEFEEREFTLRQAAFLAVTLTALLGFSMFYVWTALVGKGWLAQLIAEMTPILESAKKTNMALLSELKAQDILAQLPSAIVIYLILSLAFALIFEKRVARWAQVMPRRRERLTAFAAPDFIVWCLIVSLLGAFAQHGVRAVEFVSINVFYVSAVVYFFQGFAVLMKYFEIFQISFFWRFLWIVVLVGQLPILMSLLGVVDYWADFRKAFEKKAAQMKKKSIRD